MSSSNSRVPARPGLYAIGHDETYYGLEVERVYVYIGKSDNLRRRLGQHAPASEQNEGLWNYLQQKIHQAKCWYAVMDKSELDKTEADLIRQIQPTFNLRGK